MEKNATFLNSVRGGAGKVAAVGHQTLDGRLAFVQYEGAVALVGDECLSSST